MDTSTWRLKAAGLRVDAGDSVNLLEYSHDGARLAAATANGNHLVWDITSGELVNPLAGTVRPGRSTSRPTTEPSSSARTTR